MNEAPNRDTTITPAAGHAPVVRVRTDLAVPGDTTPHASLRRSFLGGGAAVLVAGIVSTSASAASAAASSDAELIETCHQFAEAEIGAWYRYITAPDHLADAEDPAPDWDTLHWITATPAVTAEGWRAKALAYAGFFRDAFDDAPEDRDPSTSLLASLLRDMIAPARAAIVARMRQQYGPLPKGYTVDGMWLGAEARA